MVKMVSASSGIVENGIVSIQSFGLPVINSFTKDNLIEMNYGGNTIVSSAMNKVKEISEKIINVMFKVKPQNIEKIFSIKIEPINTGDLFYEDGTASYTNFKIRIPTEKIENKNTLAHELTHAIVDCLVGNNNVDRSIKEAYSFLGEFIIDNNDNSDRARFNYTYGYWGYAYMLKERDYHDLLTEVRLNDEWYCPKEYKKEYMAWMRRMVRKGQNTSQLTFGNLVFEKILEGMGNNEINDVSNKRIIEAARLDFLKYNNNPIHFIGAGIVYKVLSDVQGDIRKAAQLMGSLLLDPANFQGLDAYGYLERIETLIKNSASSSIKQDNSQENIDLSNNFGGIDFRSLPIVTQAMSNLSLNFSSSAINRLRSINLDTEWQGMERMASSGIRASPERLKEYAQAACVKDKITQVRDKIILYISDMLRQEEELCVETDSLLRDILVMLESVRGIKKLRQVFLGEAIP